MLSLDEYLDGPNAIAISKDDATAPARILAKFAKDAKALELKAGVVEGQKYDAAALTELAKIPSREELLSRLLGSMQSPITNLARVLNQIAEKGGAAELHTGYRRSSCRGSSRDSGYRGVRSMRKSCVTSEYKVLCA